MDHLHGAQTLTPVERANADVNGDGRVDVADVEWAMRKFGSGANFNFVEVQRASDRAFFTTADGYFGVGKHSAGPPPAADCDTDRPGIMAIDTTNNRLYVCVGGNWRYSQL